MFGHVVWDYDIMSPDSFNMKYYQYTDNIIVNVINRFSDSLIANVAGCLHESKCTRDDVSLRGPSFLSRMNGLVS